MQLASNRLNKSTAETLKWGAALVCKSIGARTKQSPKLRRVVPNPNKRAWRDGRMAKFGVYKYKQGKKVFDPIYRGGEFGMIYYKAKNSATILHRDPATGKLVKTTHEAGTGEFQVPGVEQSKKRIIGRRGLAKKAWKWIERNMDGGSGSVGDARDIASVRWGAIVGAEVTITNKLRYISMALKGGAMAVETAMARAARGMSEAMDRKLKAMAARAGNP
jgi:hypothetical protein